MNTYTYMYDFLQIIKYIETIEFFNRLNSVGDNYIAPWWTSHSYLPRKMWNYVNCRSGLRLIVIHCEIDNFNLILSQINDFILPS